MNNLHKKLEAGATLITANLRLSRSLLLGYEAKQIDRGRAVWETPDILPWPAWLERCWTVLLAVSSTEQNRASPLLLSTLQAQVLWERIIGESPSGQILLRVHGTAKLVQEAWQLLKAWRLPVPTERMALNEDGRAFAEWASRYEEACRQQQWLDHAALPDRIGEAVAQGQLAAPRSLLLMGFDELNPQQQQLLTLMQAAGAQIEHIAAPQAGGEAVRFEARDWRDEITSAARWVRARLAASPRGRIGVVVPDLEDRRDGIERLFDEILMPDAGLPGHESTERPYNISLGRSLADYPVVHAALLSLMLIKGTLSLDEMGALVRSPFLGEAEQEMLARSLLDARLRRARELRVSLGRVVYLAAEPMPDDASCAHHCPRLIPLLERFAAARRDLPSAQSPGRWARAFTELLKHLGWPGERSLSSEEYQTVEAWHGVLTQFASLDGVLPKMKLPEALARLQRLAAATIFQPKSQEAPVQVLGMLESSGMRFDELWVMGLHDVAWPASPRPNPFLPYVLQQQQRMPHSSSDRELEVSRRLTSRLLQSATRVVASYAGRDGDQVLRPSLLIAHLPLVSGDDLALADALRYRQVIHAAAALESLEDGTAPPVTDAYIEGGSAIFKRQAACPFLAFAEARLSARPLETAQVGLDAMTRGILAHRALELAWITLGSQERLLASDEPTLTGIIGSAVGTAIEEQASRRPQTFTERFSEVERSRLQKLLVEWLMLEKQRGDFIVHATEQRQPMTLSGIRMTLQLDRVDVLPDGSKVVIDYKTGNVKPEQWFDDRPDEPQLPLYALAMAESLSALVFAQVRSGGDMSFKGVARSEGVIPGVKAFETTNAAKAIGSWENLLEKWRQSLTGLGEAFRAGQAQVDPKDYPQTCRYCALPALCRINELSAMGLDDVEEDAE